MGLKSPGLKCPQRRTFQPRTFQPQTFQPWTFQPRIFQPQARGWKVRGWEIWGWKVHGWKVWGWKVYGWKVQGWKVWGWSLGLKSPGLKCPSTEVITSSRGITLFSWLSSSWFEVTDKDHYLTCFCRFLHSNIFFKLTSKLFKNSAQVNLCQKLSFLHLLTLHVTTDCSLNHKKSPRSEHFQNFKTVE